MDNLFSTQLNVVKQDLQDIDKSRLKKLVKFILLEVMGDDDYEALLTNKDVMAKLEKAMKLKKIHSSKYYLEIDGKDIYWSGRGTMPGEIARYLGQGNKLTDIETKNLK